MGFELDPQNVVSEIIKRNSGIYDVVYFYGQGGATTAVIEKLLASCQSCIGRNVIRTSGAAFCKTLSARIQAGNLGSPFPEEALFSCDLFIFEDIDAIACHSVAQESLYNILNWLLEHHVQIVITGSAPAARMDLLSSRICAQIAGGLGCPVDSGIAPKI